jgi:hypothetical protein
VIAARLAVAALVLSTGGVKSLTLAGGTKGIVATVHPQAAGVAVHWSVHESDATAFTGTTRTDAHGRIVIPVGGDALTTGTVTVRVGSAHVRAPFCLDPREVVVVRGACFADFSGRWQGDYDGTYFGQDSCKSWHIAGPVQLKLVQKGHTLTGTLTLVGSALQWDEYCRIIGRADDEKPIKAQVTGREASGGTLVLSMDEGQASIHGSVNAIAGTLAFSARRY